MNDSFDDSYLKRLEPENYRGQAYVHWSLTIKDPQARLAPADRAVQISRATNAHDVPLRPLLSDFRADAGPLPHDVGWDS